MNKKEIKKIYLKEIDKFNKCNKAYYDLDSPIVSDQEYDLLKDEIISFEKKI